MLDRKDPADVLDPPELALYPLEILTIACIVEKNEGSCGNKKYQISNEKFARNGEPVKSLTQRESTGSRGGASVRYRSSVPRLDCVLLPDARSVSHSCVDVLTHMHSRPAGAGLHMRARREQAAGRLQ